MNGWDFFRFMVVGWLIVLMTDLYLPSFPILATDFDVSIHVVQLTVTFFFVGNLISQVFSGPLVDHHGHHVMLVIGLAVCILGGVFASLAPDIAWMLLGRTLQGLGAGAMQISNMSLFKELCPKENIAKYSSYLGVSYVGAIAVAPVFGGYILYYSAWQVCFVVMTLSSVVVGIWHRLSLGPISFNQGLPSMRDTLRAWRSFMADSYFLAMIAMVACTYLMVVSWVTVSPVLIRTSLGVDAVLFGWLVFLTASSYVLGAFFNAKLVNRFGAVNMLAAGLSCTLFSALLMLLLWYLYGLSLVTLLLPMLGVMMGVSWSFPNYFALLFKNVPLNLMGKAGSLYGVVGVLGSCVGSALMSWAHMDDQRYFVLILLLACLASCGLFIIFIKGQQSSFDVFEKMQ